jgi:uncharacterized membrane protein YhhN
MFDIPPGPDPETLKVGGKSAGRLVPRWYLQHQTPGPEVLTALGGTAFGAALIYGLFFLSRPPSVLKTMVKTAAVGALAVTSLLYDRPVLLTLGLALSALGDAFLAGDAKRWLPFGLASFLAAHLAYVALFATTVLDAVAGSRTGHDVTYALGPATIGLMAIATIGAIGMLWWLWRDLGKLRLAVSAYVAAILAMVCTALALPDWYSLAPVGAVLFFASDAILSIQLFKQRFDHLLGRWAVWSFYFLAQVLIARAFAPNLM